MKLHNYIAFIVLISLCGHKSMAQTLLSNAGGYTSNSSGSVSWSIGEPFIASAGVISIDFATSGFQQPDSMCSPVLPIAPILAYDSVLCAGGRIRLSAESYYYTTYQWYRNDTLVQSGSKTVYLASEGGTYAVLASKDSACSTPISKTITIDNSRTAPTDTITYTSTVVCQGPITLSAPTGLSAYQWIYNGGRLTDATTESITPYYSGNYSVNVKASNGCTNASDSVPITLSTNVGTPGIFVSAAGALLQVSNIIGSATGLKFQWYAQNRVIVNDTSNTMPLLYNGTYNVEVIYPNGCKMFSADYTKTGLSENILRAAAVVTDSTIILPSAYVTSFSVYPNPNSGVFTIDYSSLPGDQVNVKLYNATGILLNSWNFENTSGKLSETIITENLASGMYILTLADGSHSYTQKIVIK